MQVAFFTGGSNSKGFRAFALALAEDNEACALLLGQSLSGLRCFPGGVLMSQTSPRGFLTNPLAFISQVQANLEGYQSGYPVMRELVQNADDGGARRVKFLIVPPLKADHPLFAATGLLVINDGAFRATDSKAIRHLHLGHKIVETDTIGKFGLGLKSVFHLAELFCFGASGIVDSDNSGAFCEILNPWHGLDHPVLGPVYETWSEFTELDQQRLLDLVRSNVDWDTWFFVYLPFRRRQFCPVDQRGKEVTITPSFIGDEVEQQLSLWWPGLCLEIASALPLLRFVKQIEQVRLDVDPPQVTRLEMASDAIRSRLHFGLAPGQSSTLCGGFELTSSQCQASSIIFAGRELCSGDKVFDEIRGDQHWPRKSVLYESLLQSDDKNIPHGATYFAFKPASSTEGELRLIQATFLPVGGPLETYRLPTPLQVDLVLHGYYFVDPSRTRVHLAEINGSTASHLTSEQLTRSWNRCLFERAVLAQLPEALLRFAQELKKTRAGNDELIRCVTSSLQRSPLLKANLSAVNSKHCWECRLGAAKTKRSLLRGEMEQVTEQMNFGPVNIRWVLISTDARPIPPLQMPEAGLEELLDTFPRLHQLAAVSPVLAPRSPYLSNLPRRSGLDASELVLLLGKDPKDFLKGLESEQPGRPTALSQRLLLLGTLLRESESLSREWIEPWVVQLLRLLFAKFSVERATEIRSALSPLIRLVPATHHLVFSRVPDSRVSLEYLRMLNRCPDFGRLAILSAHCPDIAASAPLNQQEVRAGLKLLQGQPGGVCDQVVSEIVLHADAPRERVWTINSDLLLFSAFDALSQKEQKFSFEQLEAARVGGRLFLLASLRPKFENLMASALEAGARPILVVPRESAELLYGSASPLPKFDCAAAARMLESLPPLGQPKPRAELLVELGRQPWREEWLPAFRYLLHAHAPAFSFEGFLWEHGPVDDDLSWPGVLSRLLEHQASDWRVVDNAFSANLPREMKQRLELRVPDERSICEELWKSPRVEGLSDKQVQFLKVNVQDDLLIKQLPIHRTVDGRYVSVLERTFLAPDYPLPEALLDRLVLIERAADRVLLQRQLRWIPELETPEILEVALEDQNPSRFHEMVLDKILKNPVILQKPALQKSLRDRPWVPLTSGQNVGFSSLLSWPELEEPLDNFLNTYGQGNHSVRQVSPSVKRHPVWKKLCAQLLPSPVEDCVLNLLRGEKVPALGELPDEVIKSREASELLFLIPEALLPTVTFLKDLVAFRSELRDDIVETLRRPAPFDRLISLYRWCVERYSKEKAGKRVALALLAKHFLASASEHEMFESQWTELPLLSSAQHFHAATELCHGVAHADPRHVLDTAFAAIISPYLPEEQCQPECPPSQILASSAQGQSLHECFRVLFRHEAWNEAAECLGALYAVFAPLDPALAREVQERLGCEVESVRGNLLLPNLCTATYDRVETLARVALYYAVELEVVDAARLEVWNLLGELMTVGLTREAPQHLVLHANYRQENWTKVVWRIQLRLWEPMGVGADKVQEILRSTLWELIWRCQYSLSKTGERDASQARPFINTYWQERVLKANQFNLRLVQQIIEEDLPFYLRMLPRTKVPILEKTLSLRDQLKRSYLEEEDWRRSASQAGLEEKRQLIKHAGGHWVRLNPNTAERKLQQLQEIEERIAQLVREDLSVQSALLGAVKETIGGKYQYTIDSIPYELFQNADDACEEWVHMEPDRVADSFLIEENKKKAFLLFGHKGRPINCYRSSTGNEYRDLGYHRDLDKMLILQSSDKEVGDKTLQRTGKFGLGFKSVFLASDTVEVRSRNLAFHVVGGLYPKSTPLAQWPSRDDDFSTLVKLKCNQKEHAAWTEAVLGRFLKTAALQLVFAHRIRHIVWNTAGGESRILSWQPQRLLGEDNLEVGYIADLTGSVSNFRVLVARCPSGVVLINVGEDGPAPLWSDEVPRCWVTTPLSETCHANFIFNARFEINVARRRLTPDNKGNEKLAAQLGNEVGRALGRLLESKDGERWSEVQRCLGLSKNVDSSDFGAALWRVFSVSHNRPLPEDDEVGKIARHLERECLLQLGRLSNCVPTGLPGKFSRSTTPSEVRGGVEGLITREAVFRSCQSLVESLYKPGELVEKQVLKVLSSLYPQRKFITTNFVQLLKEILVGWKLKPGLCSAVGSSCHPQFLAKYRVEFPREVADIEQLLSKLQVLNVAAQWVPLSEVLCSGQSSEQEERLLSAFCPAAARLSEDYCKLEAGFIGAVRGKPRLDAETVAKWLLGCADPVAQEAGLRYILAGELGRDVGFWMNRWFQSRALGWRFEDHLHAFDIEEQQSLHQLLAPINQRTITPARPQTIRRMKSVEERVRALRAWWLENRASCLSKYEERVYPIGYRPGADQALSKVDARKSWFVLLSIGILHSLGRQTYDQSRCFLELLERRGWLERLFEAPNGNAFSDVLEEYFTLEDDQQFLHWLRCLPGMYQVSRWFDDYHSMLQEFNKGQRLRDFLRARNSVYYQGSGIYAPNLHRTMKVGIHFVLRELCRNRIIQADEVHDYCFVPTQRVRERMARLTDKEFIEPHQTAAKLMYREFQKYLPEDPHFGLCFDLPLSLVPKSTFESIVRA